MNTETDGLKERLRLCAKMAGSGDELARKTGIPRRTLESYLSGRSEPKATTAWHIARSCGVSADWLISGDGPMRLGDAPTLSSVPLVDANAVAPVADKRLIGRLTEKIAQIYQEMGVAIALHQVAERATEEHNRLVATVTDPIERLVEVGAVGERLRQELLTAASDPGSSKRQA